MKKLLINIAAGLAAVWLVALTVTLLLASFLPSSAQISFAFVGSGGYAGIRLLDLDYHLTVRIADTSSPVRTGNVQPSAYSWSPDGQQFVYEDRSRGTPRLMRRHITGPPELLAEAASGCNNPVWSARDQIAYLCGGILYLLNGQDAPDERREIRAGDDDTFFRDLIWSGDGTRLALITSGEQNLLAVYSAAGEKLLEQPISFELRPAELLDWSADGLLSYRAVQSWRPPYVEISDTAISEPQVISLSETSGVVSLLDFAWSPDNTLAGFVQSGRPGDLVIMEGQLKTQRQHMPFTNPAITELVWSADSRSVYVNQVWTLSRSNIARYDVETGELIPVIPASDVRIVNLQRRPAGAAVP